MPSPVPQASARSAVTVGTPTGRQISADVVGPVDGAAVVLFHPAPGSRRLDPDPDATATAGVRLITVDRAGYGGSDQLREGELPTIAGHADDTAAVLDALGVRDAVMVGWSAGGRVAAAVAARRHDLARQVFVVATPAPDESVHWLPDEQRAEVAVMRSDPIGSVRRLASMLANAGTEPGTAISMMSAGSADAIALTDPGVRAFVVAMLAEAFAQGTAGLAADIVSYTAAPWGFTPSSISAPTTCVYGDADELVPPPHGEWWADHIPGAKMMVIHGAGHLVIREAWPLVLSMAAA